MRSGRVLGPARLKQTAEMIDEASFPKFRRVAPIFGQLRIRMLCTKNLHRVVTRRFINDDHLKLQRTTPGLERGEHSAQEMCRVVIDNDDRDVDAFVNLYGGLSIAIPSDHR